MYYSFHTCTATLINALCSIFNNYKKKKNWNLLWNNIFPDISRMFVLACLLRVILIVPVLDIQSPMPENMYSDVIHEE